jgi:glycosyltransferase involved in cell wall biosynthesis
MQRIAGHLALSAAFWKVRAEDNMKITFVSPAPNLSGGIRVIAIYADLLLKRGHDVTVVAPRQHAPPPRAQLKALLKGRWISKPSATSHYDGMKAKLHLVDHAGPVKDADLPDADVVIATWWETAFAVAALSPEKGRKFYFIQGHEVFEPLPAHISSGSYYLPLSKITISGWLRDIMIHKYNDLNVALVPNGVDPNHFKAIPRGRQRVPTIGFVYSSLGLKGIDIALLAIERLRKSYPTLRVIAFGAERPSSELPLPEGSEFFLRPEQQRIPEIYAMCDVFVSASRSEGFGLPIVEALACRCPVVATRTGCAGDVIRNGINGFVVEVDDVEGLARGLQQVLNLPEPDWIQMSEAAVASTQSYSWEAAAELIEAALISDPAGEAR